jgi:DNA polymerase alpha subunit B
MGEGSLSVYLFSGPYTFSDSLDFKPLKHIVDLISEKQPNLVILSGPFLDVTHNLIGEGELFYKDEDDSVNCFEDQEVYAAIKEYLLKRIDASATKIAMLPSTNDMLSLFPFPQPPLSKKDKDNV